MLKNNSNYVPFARKYRPSKFSELLGQEVLIKTLTYCIQNQKLAQAYLLTGIRGVGKTSSARIIAKTVNCTDLQKNDGQIIPCNSCKNCESFNNYAHPDIIEIDAASRTSVDDIRRIIESCEYRPLLGRMKFFIIDEVHMLSKSAFNALLKIIEEPPEHVVFIFATTEVQKIPLTVVSRCQRYDLRRLTFEEIYILAHNISEKENFKIEDEALKIIAAKSEGSARDATVMIDQVVSYVHNSSDSIEITAELVAQMLGLLQAGTVVKFTQLILANNPSEVMKLLDNIYVNANSLEYFVQVMSDFMAELSKSKVITNYHNPLYQSYSKEISAILIGMSLSRVTTLWQIFSNGVQQIKQSHNELVTVQMLIIKAIYSCNLPPLEEIMNANAVVAQVSINQDGDFATHSLNNIFDFLKYCYGQNKKEIYYFLLNEVEIKEFSRGKVEFAYSNDNSHTNKIEILLKFWSGLDWKVIAFKQSNIISLKDEMLEKVKQAEDYQVIKNNFPEANISDIILKS